MSVPFAFRLAWRESRSSVRRLGLYMAAITLGVGALVAINAYRVNIVDAVQSDAQRLMGGDLRLSSDRAFPDSVSALLDSLTASGARVAHVVSTLSMGFTRPLASPDSGDARLIQVRAIEAGYPFYDTWETQPAGLWPQLALSDGDALVERVLLLQTGAAIGDSIQIGQARFRIAGELGDLPAELGFRGAIGPRVFIPLPRMFDTGLLGFGSLAQHQVYVQVDDAADAQRFVDRYHDMLRRLRIGFDTAVEQGEEIAEAVSALSRFLGLVGLTALLLGGLGVGSAVNVFVKDKRATIATLRCIGATQRQAFVAYLLQAGLLGLAGATAGVVLGIGVQAILPVVLRDMLPVDVPFRIRPLPILTGLTVGVTVAILFALLPLLEIRGITPLQAIRHDVEPVRRRFDPVRGAAYVVLIAGVTGLAIWQADDWRVGLAYAGAIVFGILLLGTCAALLVRATRRWAPRRGRYVVRQGIASLFRPHNQTTAVTVALGFGVFVVGTIWLVQHNLVARFGLHDLAGQPNLIAFGIQSDQRAGIDSVVRRHGSVARIEPIVTARIVAINGVITDSVLATARARNVEPWALRREYRNTYRDTLTSSEQLVAGTWFDGTRAPATGRTAQVPAGDGADTPARISVEQEVMDALGTALGDTITWNVQGRIFESVITSVRTVDWARLETNFFVVFEGGALEDAPQNLALLTHVRGDTARVALQRDLASAYPNVTAVDLEQVQRTIERIISRATLGIRFMGLFSVIGGILVLAGAIAASRYQRLRETVLLRALGAQRAQIRAILLTEYAALGLLAAVTGTVLAVAGSWALTHFVFEFDFVLPALAVPAIVLGTVALAVGVGAAGSREALRSTPLAVIREMQG